MYLSLSISLSLYLSLSIYIYKHIYIYIYIYIYNYLSYAHGAFAYHHSVAARAAPTAEKATAEKASELVFRQPNNLSHHPGTPAAGLLFRSPVLFCAFFPQLLPPGYFLFFGVFIPCFTMLYYTILNYTILYYTIIYYTMFYYALLFSFSVFSFRPGRSWGRGWGSVFGFSRPRENMVGVNMVLAEFIIFEGFMLEPCLLQSCFHVAGRSQKLIPTPDLRIFPGGRKTPTNKIVKHSKTWYSIL